MKSWKVHAPKLAALDMTRVLELARRTPYYEDALLAIDLLVNPATLGKGLHGHLPASDANSLMTCARMG